MPQACVRLRPLESSIDDTEMLRLPVSREPQHLQNLPPPTSWHRSETGKRTVVTNRRETSRPLAGISTRNTNTLTEIRKRIYGTLVPIVETPLRTTSVIPATMSSTGRPVVSIRTAPNPIINGAAARWLSCRSR